MKHRKIHHHSRVRMHGKKTTAAQVAGFVLVTLLALGTMDFLIVNSDPGVFQVDQTMGHHGPGGV